MSLAKKFFVFIFTLSTLYFVLTTSVYAEGEFATNYDVTYRVKDTGITEVTNKITLTNVYSNLYATSYSIVLGSIVPKNTKAFDSNGVLELVESIEDSLTTLEVKFKDTLVGKNQSRTFYIIYDENTFAVRTGEVWEISIPRVSSEANFESYNVNLEIPTTLGQEAYISPNPKSKSIEDGLLKYRFNKDDIVKTGIVAGFGQFQVFNFSLNYHLENPLNRNAETEISLPPDNAFQKVYYRNISPKPTSMHVDSDGNWIAVYRLKPRERIDVVANGEVQIFASLRPYPKPSQEQLNENIKALEFWQSSNPQIQELARKYKTPKEIYDFVSTHLTYNYDRVRPNVERLGALKALEDPSQAICMEFTDLFIAIARAAGIPAREVNGFAYTENPEIQPLSLVNDVLHAWPEYYDFEKGAWIAVDPTWGSTTGGVDYFSKLDLRHFTFVIHGKDSVLPYAAGSYKLGANPQKDVFVTFGKLEQNKNSVIKLDVSLQKFLPLISNKLDIKISNPGPVAIYNIKPQVYFDNQQITNNNEIEVLLPFQSYNTFINIPFSFLGTNTPKIVKVVVDQTEVSVETHRNQVIIYNLLFIFVIVFLILLIVFLKFKKWKIKIPYITYKP